MVVPHAAGMPAGPPATQASRPAGASVPGPLLSALGQVEDFSFAFWTPPVQQLVRYVASRQIWPDASAAVPVQRWSDLVERPADFRGRLVAIEGIVGRNRAWKPLDPRLADLGPVWQLELWGRREPLACTVLLTSDASDIAIGSTIRVVGYFAMIRQYRTQRGEVRQAAVIVAPAPQQVLTKLPPAMRPDGRRTWGVMAALLGGLAIAWLLLRRSTAREPTDLRTLTARRPAPLNLSRELAEWACMPESPAADASEPAAPAEGISTPEAPATGPPADPASEPPDPGAPAA